MRKRFSIFSVLAIATFAGVVSPAGAAINVTTTADELLTGSGCSLREAVTAINTAAPESGCPSGANEDTIRLLPGTYALTRAGTDDMNAVGDLDVRAPIKIVALGSKPVIIDGAAGGDRVFHHALGASLSLDGITVRNGNATGIADGGGILNAVGTLSLDAVTLSGNRAGVDGGAIANYAQATISNSTISGNFANNSGGGIYTPGGATTTLRSATVAGNTADADASNDGDGGGISVVGSLSATNTLIADNADLSPAPPKQAPDCASGPNFFPRHTLIEVFDAGTCLVGFNPGTNVVNQDPRLAPLGDNGGTTPTQALLTGSPAIDAGGTADPDLCPETDQRGVPLSLGGLCDIGAYQRVTCAKVLVNRVGTDASEKVRGTTGRDGILGLGGDDVLKGRGKGDALCGGDGDDKLKGGSGRDKLRGQKGEDNCLGGPGKDRPATGCEEKSGIP